MTARPQALAPRNPVGHAPLRPPDSIRRTTSIDVTWPDGREGRSLMQGRARDLRSPRDGAAPKVLREDTFEARLGWDRVIHEIGCAPARAQIGQLVGARGGGHLRGVLDRVMHEELVDATPLYLILDDISGVSLVCGWAWSRWTEDWMSSARALADGARAAMRGSMENICIGFRTGSSALVEGGPSPSQNAAAVVPLPNPDDPLGWHALPEAPGVHMRRARRIDVWRDDVIRIDAGFQDSASVPGGGRVAIHEYTLEASADPVSGKIARLMATPRVLPFPECPGAVRNLIRIEGEPLAKLRTRVIDLLPGTLGCTHLNDILRSLADVPSLLEELDAS